MNNRHMSDASFQELCDLCYLLPPLGSPSDERHELRATILAKLPHASNDTIASLAMIRRGLALAELERRLEKGVFTLAELFRLAMNQVDHTHPPKKLWPITIAEVGRVGLLASQDEIIALARDWEDTELNQGHHLIYGILELRPDGNDLRARIPPTQRRAPANVRTSG